VPGLVPPEPAQHPVARACPRATATEHEASRRPGLALFC
jgi:hypothetical protein